MIFHKLNVEPRQNPARHSQIKKSFKSKASLPQTCSSAEAAFEKIKLCQSHDIQNLFTSEFQLNIIPPINGNNQGEKTTKKLSTPQWLISSNMLSSVQGELLIGFSENPQCSNESQNVSNQYRNSFEQSEKTELQNGNDLQKVNKSQIQRILEMTVSDDRERQINETYFKSQIHSDDLDSKTSLIQRCSSQNSVKANQSSLQLKRNDHKNLVVKPKSAILISGKLCDDLDQYYKEQYELFSEYGLKPSEKNRLKKIQQIQKMELIRDQGQNIQGEQSEHDQEYFNVSKSKKTIRDAQKFRKSSAALASNENINFETNLSKKSKSKQKHSLSKDKKFKTPQTHNFSKIPSMKKITTISGKK